MKSIIPRIFGSKRSGRDGSDEDIYKSDGDGIIDLGISISQIYIMISVFLFVIDFFK